MLEMSSWFSDKAHFRLSGHVSSQKKHLLGKQIPWALSAKAITLSKVNYLGFYFQIWHYWTILEHCVTIKTDWYIQVLYNFWTERGYHGPPVVPAGSSVTPSKESLTWLNKHISDWLVVLYSPDLNPPFFISGDIHDFYIWRYLKDPLYTHQTQSIYVSKTEITVTIKAVPREECEKVIKNFTQRI